jgi:hypothetical protein
MITRKDLAPLDDASLEIWINDLKHRKDETLRDLYVFSRDFYAWPCRDHYNGEICDGCKNYDFCQSCKLTMEEVKHELEIRFTK